jgi:hypothetical protein
MKPKLGHAAGRRVPDHLELAVVFGPVALEELAQEFDARRARAAELAAFGPPQLVLGVHIRLAVARVAAAHVSLPEAPD